MLFHYVILEGYGGREGLRHDCPSATLFSTFRLYCSQLLHKLLKTAANINLTLY